MTNTKIIAFLFVSAALTVCHSTGQDLTYRITFAIEAKENVRIRFAAGVYKLPIVEVSLSNRSEIRVIGNGAKSGYVSVDTPGILDETDYRHFLFEWSRHGKWFQVYSGNEATEAGKLFPSWKNTLPSFLPMHVGVLNSAMGVWRCNGKFISETDTEYHYMPLDADPINVIKGVSIPSCSIYTWIPVWEQTEPPKLVGPEGNSDEQMVPKPNPNNPESFEPNPFETIVPKRKLNELVGSDPKTETPLNPTEPLTPANSGGGIKWVTASRGNIPEGAVAGGEDRGEVLYVARVQHGQNLLPGKLFPSHHCVYYGWEGKEYGKNTYEVLVAPPKSVAWIRTKGNADIPPNAIPGGMIAGTNQTLYIGRVSHRGGNLADQILSIGRVDRNLQSLLIPYLAVETAYSKFEILVKKLNAKEKRKKPKRRLN